MSRMDPIITDNGKFNGTWITNSFYICRCIASLTKVIIAITKLKFRGTNISSSFHVTVDPNAMLDETGRNDEPEKLAVKIVQILITIITIEMTLLLCVLVTVTNPIIPIVPCSSA